MRLGNTFFMLITRNGFVIRKTVPKILRFHIIMSKMVGIADPVCLELPELELCRAEGPPSVVHEDGGVFRRRPPFAPCLSLAAILHGTLALLALSMGLGMRAPETVVSISLLPAARSAAPAAGDAPGAAAPPPAAPVSAPVRQEPVRDTAEEVRKPERRPVKAQAPVAQAATKKDAVPEVAPAPPPAESRDRGAVDNAAPQEASASAESERSPQSDEPAPSVAGSDSGGLEESGSARVSGAPGPGLAGPALGPVGASFGDADGPRFVQRVMPRYPELARRKGREGRVLLRLVIGPDGELRNVEVVEGGGHGFDEAALAAVRASLFAPAVRHGRAVECAALLPVRFALKGS